MLAHFGEILLKGLVIEFARRRIVADAGEQGDDAPGQRIEPDQHIVVMERLAADLGLEHLEQFGG
jgi:hypothetical protein